MKYYNVCVCVAPGSTNFVHIFHARIKNECKQMTVKFIHCIKCAIQNETKRNEIWILT